MPISVKRCDCAKALKASDALAGKKVKCPDCGAVVAVPDASQEIEANGGRRESNVDDLANGGADVPVEKNAA